MTENTEATYELREVPVRSIKPSGVNPRGAKVKERDPERVRLEESVGEREILVPLVLTLIKGDKYDYMIVDGERRFYVAESLGLDSVPAHIIETPVDRASLVRTMFHIHANWQPWDAAQQCSAMEPLFEELVEEYGRDNMSQLTRSVAKLLHLNETTARDRVMFLLWPMEVKEKVYMGEHEGYWHVVEIEKSIMEPARRNFPEYFEVVDENEIRLLLFQKWEEGLVRRSAAPRRASVVARCTAAEGQKEKALEIFQRLWKVAEMTNTTHMMTTSQFSLQLPKRSESVPELCVTELHS